MSAMWEQVRRRYELVEDVLADVRTHGSVRMAVARWQQRVDQEYGDDDLGGFLRDVQRRWQRAFEARLDGVLGGAHLGGDAEDAVAGLWHTVTDLHPEARLVLDFYAGHPALVRADARQRQMLWAAAGVDIDRVLRTRPRPEAVRRARRCLLAAAFRRRSRRRLEPQPA